MNYKELEDLYVTFKQAESIYYKLRYSYWGLIHKFKSSAKQTMSYKQYEGKCRSLTRKIRRTMLKSKPRGAYQLDHSQSILESYCQGKSIEECCSPDNLIWMKKKDNQLKGILSQARWATNPFNK